MTGFRTIGLAAAGGMVMALAAGATAAGEAPVQIAQGPSHTLICRGGGAPGFDAYFRKNHYRELCVFFKWHRAALGKALPPPGHCGFAKRGPNEKERRLKLFCQSIERTFIIRRWPRTGRYPYQFISYDAPYLNQINNPRYRYHLRVRSQGTSFKVLAVTYPKPRKRKKKRR